MLFLLLSLFIETIHAIFKLGVIFLKVFCYGKKVYSAFYTIILWCLFNWYSFLKTYLFTYCEKKVDIGWTILQTLCEHVYRVSILRLKQLCTIKNIRNHRSRFPAIATRYHRRLSFDCFKKVREKSVKNDQQNMFIINNNNDEMRYQKVSIITDTKDV